MLFFPPLSYREGHHQKQLETTPLLESNGPSGQGPQLHTQCLAWCLEQSMHFIMYTECCN